MNPFVKNALAFLLVVLVAGTVSTALALTLGGETVIDQAVIGQLSGVVLSLTFFLLPWSKTWYEVLAADQKQSVNVAAIFIVSLSLIGLSCLGVESGVPCSATGLMSLLVIFVNALIGNSGAYVATKHVLGKQPPKGE